MAKMYNSPVHSKFKKKKEINILYKVKYDQQHTFILGKPMPTIKFANQLTKTAIAIALGLGPCENNSAVIIHGIEPGPTAKKTTNPSVETTDKYDIQSIISCT